MNELRDDEDLEQSLRRNRRSQSQLQTMLENFFEMNEKKVIKKQSNIKNLMTALNYLQ